MILALDIASDVGCCDGMPGGNPRLWTWHLRDAGKSRQQRLLMLSRFLSSYFIGNAVTGAFYEAPLPLSVMFKIGAIEDTVALLRGAIGVFELACAERTVVCQPVSVQDARESVFGWRTNPRGETKRRVLAEVRSIYGVEPENDHEADAFVIWRWACNVGDSKLALAGAPLFRE